MSQLALQLIRQEKEAKTGFLNIGNCGLTPDNPHLQDIWNALGELTHLETLILSTYPTFVRPIKSRNEGPRNLFDKIPTAIASLVNLKTLAIGHIRIGKISKIENLPQSLERLDISKNQITKIENLPQNILQLDISYNQISDLSPLIPFIEKGLDHRVYRNPIKYTPTFAKYLIAKEKAAKRGSLNLEFCGLNSDAPQMQDIWNALSELTHLESLTLSNQRFTIDRDRKKRGEKNLFDKIPTVIGSLVNLKNLTIRGQSGKGKILKIENLPQSLENLDISNNQISKIENLPLNLSVLRINNNQITKLENLPQSISYLQIDNNRILEMGNLPKNLSSLDISNNRISKIENLPQNLSVLRIDNNQITKLENLPQSISYLQINNNQISKVENLPDGLDGLMIRNNQIKDSEPLLSLIKKYDFYDVNDNLIENLPPEVVEQGNRLAAFFDFAKKGFKPSSGG